MTTDPLAPVRHLIGSHYQDSIKSTLLELSGLATAIGPKDFATRDVRTDRVFIIVDADGIITDLRIG